MVDSGTCVGPVDLSAELTAKGGTPFRQVLPFTDQSNATHEMRVQAKHMIDRQRDCPIEPIRYLLTADDNPDFAALLFCSPNCDPFYQILGPAKFSLVEACDPPGKSPQDCEFIVQISEIEGFLPRDDE